MDGDSYMDLARRLAERGRYTVAPNPLVGAVVVRDGEIVSKGHHARAGAGHAEVHALRGAGDAARGATMYVTLEPCNHHGKTPPCTDAILRAGVSRVVVGHLDPDPRMRGKSVALLRKAGVDVGVLDAPFFEEQNEQFAFSMREGRPFVHLKLAATLDGRISAAGGDSKWITSQPARRRAHELRAEAGAVLVGAGTVRSDDPLLTPRDLPEEPPRVVRAVVDPNLTTTAGSRLARSVDEGPVLVFAGEEAASGERADALRSADVEVVATPAETGAGLDLSFVLEELSRWSVRGVLVEGGGETAARFLGAGLADKLTFFYAPKVVGSEGAPMIGALGIGKMADALRFSVADVGMVGEDVVVTLYPTRNGEEELVHRAG